MFRVYVVPAVLACRRAAAQGITATISGIVLDDSGAVLPGATVTVTNLDTRDQRTLTSDEGGRYVAPSLPPGITRSAPS